MNKKPVCVCVACTVTEKPKTQSLFDKFSHSFNICIYREKKRRTQKCVLSLANFLRAVADALCPLRTHQCY